MTIDFPSANRSASRKLALFMLAVNFLISIFNWMMVCRAWSCILQSKTLWIYSLSGFTLLQPFKLPLSLGYYPISNSDYSSWTDSWCQ
jgi:hypothetical protein